MLHKSGWRIQYCLLKAPGMKHQQVINLSENMEADGRKRNLHKYALTLQQSLMETAEGRPIKKSIPCVPDQFADWDSLKQKIIYTSCTC